MTAEKVVTIGASSGGIQALSTLAGALPADFPAPVLVVQHIGHYPSVLPQILSRRGSLPAAHPSDREEIRGGRIYVAPPDHHMLLDGSMLRLSRGPKEHHSRPAIDPLFLSAALSHGPGVVGVLLTGNLDDGTAGLQAVKRCGGVVIVQDPDEAEAPSMPLSALKHVPVDHCVRMKEMAAVLLSTVRMPLLARTPSAPGALIHEHDLTLSKGRPMDHLEAIGHRTTFTCPDCSGSLWEITDSNPARYRCHTGHGFTARSLLGALSVSSDSALWGAVRALQEESMLLTEMGGMKRTAGDIGAAMELERAARVVEQRARSMRRIVESVPSIGTDDAFVEETEREISPVD